MMQHNNRIKGWSNNHINLISIITRDIFWLLVSSSTICYCKYYSSHAFHVVVTRRHPHRQQRHHRWGSSTPPSTLHTISKRLNTESTSHTCLSGSGGSVVNDASNEMMSVVGQPNYSLDRGSIDLSKRWIDLVSEGHVKAVVELPPNSNDNQNNCRVEYGVRMVRQQLGSENDTPELYKCEEYVIEAGRDDDNENESSSSSSEPHPLISSINATLSSRQKRSGGSIFKWSTSSGGGKGKQGPSSFVAQLQLVRTLRPPPSEGFVGATSNIPPPYNSETDSFVTGPLRLQLRPRVAKISMAINGNDDDDNGWKRSKLSTPWDVYHNVSPADTRGHFLLAPTLDDEDNNWRGQIFTAQDAHDLVWITQSIEPVGSLVIGYNSVGAGASQNHIHCHAWPCPPVPLLSETQQQQHDRDIDDDDDDDTNKGWNVYPVSKVKEIYDFYDIDDGAVEVSFLEYPVFCLLLSASTTHLDLLSKALSTCLDNIGEAPYNIAFLNRKQKVEFETEEIVFDATTVNNDKETEDDETTDFVDIYLFARSKERSDHVPEHKLGISEMMGVFHAQSEEQLERWASDVVTDTINGEEVHDEGEEDDDDHDHDDHHHGHFNSKGVMYQSLLDVSIENEWEIWEMIKTKLSLLS